MTWDLSIANPFWPLDPLPNAWDVSVPVQSGYDPLLLVSSAVLAPTAYVTQSAIEAKLGGAQYLIEGTDDQSLGNLNTTILAAVIANVTEEIDGYLAPIYPKPLVRTGTVTVVKVETVDANGGILTVSIVKPGYYFVAPASPNTVKYPTIPDWLRQNYCNTWLPAWLTPQQNGTGAQLAVTFNSAPDPFIATAVTVNTAGTGYVSGDILLFQGGQSYVPPKVRHSALVLCCADFFQRRLAPDETKNPYIEEAKSIRKELMKVSNGDSELDGNYRRFFSPGSAWVQESRLNMSSL